MAVVQRKGQAPHTRWINLKGDDILSECAVLKEDSYGNIHFIEIPLLDDIDKNRLAGILRDRNILSFELWDIMAQKTLNNGVNALEYFHQLVKVMSPAGKVMNPREGQIGVGKMAVSNIGAVAEGSVEQTAVASAEPELTPAQKGAATKAANAAKKAAEAQPAQ